ncbi:MAG: S8 family serine peptidase, partial [Planctomycetes bacterium]|nr:S8 family serine peptidase [Planctomycetota bacterium]
DVVVAVIDTGCCITHPDLEHQIWTNPGEIPGNGIDDEGNGFVDDIHGWNFEDNNNDVNDVHYWGHGTHVSGTVAGDGANGETTGMAPDCAVMACKFWNDWAGESTVWQSMQYAADNGAHVISASLGWIASVNPDRATWRATCENTIAMGVVVVYSASNEGNSYPPYSNVRTPGDVPDVITVGATDCLDNVWSESSRGPVTWQTVAPYYDWPYPPGKIKPSICAPGVDTLSTSTDSNCTDYATLSGTSMATPHVSGTVALMLEANPGLDHFAVKDILMNTALDLGDPGFDNESGMGRVNAYEAVLAALESACPGDLDGDNDIDLSDLSQLLAHYGTTSGASYEDGDLDHDGDVDLNDLAGLLAVYGTPCP